MKRVLTVLCVLCMLTGIINVRVVYAGTVNSTAVANCAYAYTYKNDPNQTTQKYNYNYNVRLGSNYVSGSPADIERGLYTKFDISSYIEQGYTIQKAEYVMKFAKATFNLKLALLDCPDNVIQTGVTNYLTAPSTAGQPIVTVSTYGDVPLSGYTGVPSDWNFAGDITAYVNNKVEAGQYSFTITPIYWYVGTLCINELPMLYLTLVKNVPPSVNIISSEEGALIDISQPYEFRATATDTDGNITKVDFYVNSNLVGTSDTSVQDTYSVSLPPNTIPRGPCILQAIATDDTGGTSSAAINIRGSSSNPNILNGAIGTTDYANIKYGDPNQVGADQYTNYYIQGNSDGTPNKALVLKYDISDYADNDIKKVEMIFRAGNTSTIDLYEAYSNDWKTGINYLGVPEYSSTPFLRNQITADSNTPPLVDLGYNLDPNASDKPNVAVDISEFMLQKVERGQKEFSFFMTSSKTINICMKLPMLYITYTDNTRPSVVLTSSPEDAATPNVNYALSAEIKDVDGTISSASFKFDNVEYEPEVQIDDIYTITIPADMMYSGSHDIEVSAIDDNGGRTATIRKIIWGGDPLDSKNGLMIYNTELSVEGNTAKTMLNIDNLFGLAPIDYTAIIASYSIDSKLLKTSVFSGNKTEKGKTVKTFTQDIPSGTEYVKVFIWNETRNMISLCESVNTERLHGKYTRYRSGLKNTFLKLKNEKTASIVYFGGSVTAGMGSSNAELYSWRAKTTQWFRDKFPNANVKAFDATIGGTGSELGSYRVEHDVLKHNPDLVFVEFAINDTYCGDSVDDVKLQYETIIRKILEQNPYADIVAIYTGDRTTALGTDEYFLRAKAQDTIAEYYDISSVNVGWSLFDTVDLSNESVWHEYFIDGVHPTDKGYAAYAKTVIDYLERDIVDFMIEIPQEYSQKSIPNALNQNWFKDARIIDGTQIDISGSDNWELRDMSAIPGIRHHLYSRCLVSSTSGREFSLNFTGKDVGIYFAQGNKSGGNIEFSIDGGEYQLMSTYNISYPVKMFAENLPYGEHTIRVKVSETQELSSFIVAVYGIVVK